MADQEQPIVTSRRVTSRWDAANKYKINQLAYPDDVASSPDMQHYVMFYINIRKSSKFNKDSRIGLVTTEGQNRVSYKTNGVESTTKAGALTFGPGVAAGTAISSIAKVVENKTGVSGKLKGMKTSTLAGLAGGAVSGAALVKFAGSGEGAAGTIMEVEKTQRINDVITLALQSAPSTKYGVAWEIGDLGSLVGGFLGGGTSAADQASNMGAVGSDLARRVTETLASLPSSLNANNQLQNLIQGSTKRVANPMRENLFKSVGFRSFEFSYKFMPKSAKESQTVNDIINTFKFHMHPELSPTGIYYIYPSDFDIVYYYKGEENQWFNKISTCALTDMNVTYGGDNFSTFDQGAPTEITLTLTFTELETLTKERIKEGY